MWRSHISDLRHKLRDVILRKCSSPLLDGVSFSMPVVISIPIAK